VTDEVEVKLMDALEDRAAFHNLPESTRILSGDPGTGPSGPSGSDTRVTAVISIDRDLNASLNIRNIGINTLGHSGINACGDGSLEPSLKQEKECLEN